MDIKVPKMSCNNCVAKIQVQMLRKGIEAQFDLNNKKVSVKENEYENAVSAINAAGYDIEA